MQFAMKHVIWFVRFWYAAWMIPAGVEHFYHIFPQPGANSSHPLAAEMLTALLNTHLFDVVKAVELITGVAVLFGVGTYFLLNPLVGGLLVGLFEKLDPGSDGSGVGLALVRRIIDLHQGRVWVESEGVGHGTTVCFTLPDAPATAMHA